MVLVVTKHPKHFVKPVISLFYVENLILNDAKQEDNLVKKEDIKDIKQGTDEKVVIKHQIDVATLNLIYKAVKDNSDDSGWAYLGTVGTYFNC
jgi:hypothetical protein